MQLTTELQKIESINWVEQCNNSQTYWNRKGVYQDLSQQLFTMLPDEGAVPSPRKNPKLEKLRKACNCYHDLYNNGLCNRVNEFRKVYGLASSAYRKGYYDHNQTLYMLTEKVFNKILLEAAAEQGLIEK